jgi:hypothetical protein
VGLFFPCGVFNYSPGGLFYYSDFTFKQLLIVLIGKDTPVVNNRKNKKKQTKNIYNRSKLNFKLKITK